MRVLFITNGYPTEREPYRGIFFREQAIAVTDEKVQIDIISPVLLSVKDVPVSFKSQIDQRTENGCRVIVKEVLNKAGRLSLLQSKIFHKTALELFQKYIELYGKPDLLHGHFGIWSGYSAMLISNNYNIPYLVTEHSSIVLNSKGSKFRRNALKKIYNGAKCVIAVSHPLKLAIQKQYEVAGIHVVPNVVDTDKFNLNDQPRQNIILSIGRLIPSKRFDIVIESFELLLKEMPDYKLLIVGDGSQRSSLQRLVDQKKLGAKVELLGKVNHDELSIIYNQSKIFALASEFETFGVVFIEALSAGLPCISTPCGGPSDILTSQVGVITTSWDPHEFSDSMLQMLNNYENYSQIYIRNYAVEKYGKFAVRKRMHEIYQTEANSYFQEEPKK